MAKGLIAAGIEAGDRVALISRTRYEWTLLDYAIWFAGAVTVPVYETSSAAQIEWILTDSGARGVVTETPEHASRVKEVRDGLSEVHHVWSIEGNGVGVLRTLGRRRLRRGARGAPYGRRAGRSRHGHLHLRHHRPAQGMRAHARQLHLRAHGGPRRARRAVRPVVGRRAGLHAALPATRATSSPGSSRSGASRPASGWATPPTSRTSSTTSPSSGPRSSSRFRGSSRRCSTPPPSVPWPTGAARSSTVRPTWPSPGHAPWSRADRASPSARSTGCSTRWSTASSGRRSVAGASSPSPAVLPSATGWGTSTAASASTSWRATGSPRRPPR